MATKYRIGVGPRLIQAGFTFFVNRAGHQILRAATRLPLPAPVDVETAPRTRVSGGQDWLAGRTPRELAGALLSELPDRWAHTQTAAAQAERVASTVPARDRDLLIAAAWLHDIGYAAQLDDTGFHPLDGARYLRRIGAPLRLACLVAHHSEADLLAQARGLLDQLEQFPQQPRPITDALAYADMTAGPTGIPMTVAARLADIRIRHAAEPPRLKAARLSREPLLSAAAARVRRRMADTGRPSIQA